nr:Gfo/Idh/MocA family oxidoreductase [Sphingomonas sp. Leaf357]
MRRYCFKSTIGVSRGDWAKYGHIAALQTLDEFKVVAIGSRTQATADAVAEEYGIPNAFNDGQTLIEYPDVDLVAVLTPALEIIDRMFATSEASFAKIVYHRSPARWSERPL